MLPLKPAHRENSPYTTTKYFAFMGIGGNSSRITWLGNISPNASSTPNTPPEAPTVG